jgi:hypothetical protein
MHSCIPLLTCIAVSAHKIHKKKNKCGTAEKVMMDVRGTAECVDMQRYEEMFTQARPPATRLLYYSPQSNVHATPRLLLAPLNLSSRFVLTFLRCFEKHLWSTIECTLGKAICSSTNESTKISVDLGSDSSYGDRILLLTED